MVTLKDRALPHTTDPIAYARAVAISLFDWDTSLGFLPTDYTAAVLADADPSGEETSGLVADVATYLPTVDQWLNLGAMEVRQTIEFDDAYVPDSWSAAVQQAHGHLRPGTTAVTVTGTRHRSGVWSGESRRTWQRSNEGSQATKTVNATGCDDSALSPFHTPLRCRVPVTVTAVVPGRRWPCACWTAAVQDSGT